MLCCLRNACSPCSVSLASDEVKLIITFADRQENPLSTCMNNRDNQSILPDLFQGGFPAASAATSVTSEFNSTGWLRSAVQRKTKT
jgi:hypothetical protein